MELNPLNQIHPVVIASVIVIFAITYFVLRKAFFLPVIEVMERRNSRIEASRALREEAAGASRQADFEAEEVLRKARERAESVVSSAREEVERERSARLDKSRADNVSFLERERAKIMKERTAEVDALRDEATACVTMACEKLLDGADPHLVSSVVDHLVARRVH